MVPIIGAYDPTTGNIAITRIATPSKLIRTTSHEIAHKAWREKIGIVSKDEVKKAVNEGMADVIAAVVHSETTGNDIIFDARAESTSLTLNSYDPLPDSHTHSYPIHKNGDIVENLFYRVKLDSNVSKAELKELIIKTFLRMNDQDADQRVPIIDVAETMKIIAKSMSTSVQAAVTKAINDAKISKVTYIHSTLFNSIVVTNEDIGNERQSYPSSSPGYSLPISFGYGGIGSY